MMDTLFPQLPAQVSLHLVGMSIGIYYDMGSQRSLRGTHCPNMQVVAIPHMHRLANQTFDLTAVDRFRHGIQQ